MSLLEELEAIMLIVNISISNYLYSHVCESVGEYH